jgi:hypothetical protein
MPVAAPNSGYLRGWADFTPTPCARKAKIPRMAARGLSSSTHPVTEASLSLSRIAARWIGRYEVKSAKYSDVGMTPVSSRCSRARVQAT